MHKKLIALLKEKGIIAKLVPIKYVSKLKKEIEKLYTSNLLDKEFYESYLKYLTVEEEISNMKSILILAVKAFQINFTFNYKNKKIPICVPPIYIDKNNNLSKTDHLLTDFLNKEKHKFQYGQIPQKLLAVSTGLAEYGKNNITYINGLGSHFDLMSFYTDIDIEIEHIEKWDPYRIMDKCENCRLCVKSCPTGAISESRFLLHGEKCITYFNEQDCNNPFPDWIKKDWHNCLIGCNICQKVCPENKINRDQFLEGCEFTEEETLLFLKNTDIKRLPLDTRKKIELWKLKDNYNIYDLIPRNLPVLLNKILKKQK